MRGHYIKAVTLHLRRKKANTMVVFKREKAVF